MESNQDGFDELFSTIVLGSTGWHRHSNDETGDVAYFPIMESDVDKWEQSALAMHASQERVNIPAKPMNSRARPRQVYRGD